jgi:hypothetical protein
VRLLILARPLNRDDIHAAAALLIERALRDPNTPSAQRIAEAFAMPGKRGQAGTKHRTR